MRPVSGVVRSRSQPRSAAERPRLARACAVSIALAAFCSSCQEPSSPPITEEPTPALVINDGERSVRIVVPTGGLEPSGEYPRRTLRFDVRSPTPGTEIDGLSLGSITPDVNCLTDGHLPNPTAAPRTVSARLEGSTTPTMLIVEAAYAEYPNECWDARVPILVDGVGGLHEESGGMWTDNYVSVWFDRTPAGVDVVAIVPPVLKVAVGDQAQLTATVHGETGEVLAGAPVVWQSTSPDVASVDGAGRVTGMAVGTTRIEVSSGTRHGGYTLQVVAPTPPSGRVILTYQSPYVGIMTYWARPDGTDLKTFVQAPGPGYSLSSFQRAPGGDLLAFEAFSLGGPPAVFLSNPDGTDQRQVAGNHHFIDWSPDGSRLLTQQAFGPVTIMRLDGSVERELTYGTYWVRPEQWTAEGILLVAQLPSASAPTFIARAPSEGGAFTQLTPEGTTGPVLSPGGQRLAYIQSIGGYRLSNELVLSGPDGQDPVVVGAGAPGTTGFAVWRRAWTPDGRCLFIRSRCPEDGCSIAGQLYVVNGDGTGLREIVFTTPRGRVAAIDDFQISPTGDELVFSMQDVTGIGLFRAPLNGGAASPALDLWNREATVSAYPELWLPE